MKLYMRRKCLRCSKTEIARAKSNVSEVEEIDPVNTELEPDEPLDEELPLKMSIRSPPKPLFFAQFYQKFQPETREVLRVVLTKVGRISIIRIRDLSKMKWMKKEERVSNMIIGGMDLNTRNLSLGGLDMIWNSPEQFAKIPEGDYLRVWIEFQSSMHTHSGLVFKILQIPIDGPLHSKLGCLMKP